MSPLASNEFVTGGCLCGSVRFQAELPFLRASHCHCSRCRKHSGAAMCTQAQLPRERFTLLSGEDSLRIHGAGEGAVKVFCVTCGSSLFGGKWPTGPLVSIRMGSLEGDPRIEPQFHTFVESRACWDHITDDLPQYPAAATPLPAPRAGSAS